MQRWRGALLAMGYCSIGVLVLAIRCERSPVGPGHASGVAVLVVGLMLFVLPFGFAVYKVMGSGRASRVFVAVLAGGSSIVIGTRRPAGLVAVWFPYLLLAAVTVLLVVEGILRSWARRRPARVSTLRPRRGEPLAPARTWERPASCDQCSHSIDEHVLWEPDETCDGWMHCGSSGCDSCWHTWPRLVKAVSTGNA